MAYSFTYIYAPLKWISAGLISLALSASASAQPMPGGDRGPIPAGVITLSEAQVPFSVTLPGRAIAYEEVNIRPRVDGTISEIPYEAGRKVEKGDVLFRIEGDTFEVDVAAAEAEVARAEAAVTAAEATLSRYERLQ